MLSAFVLIKLMKIKQSLALSARCNPHFFHLQPYWVSDTHNLWRPADIPEALLCPGPVTGCSVPLQMKPTTSCFLGTTKPALSSSLKIRDQWDTTGVFARCSFTCKMPRSVDSPPEILAGQPPEPCTPAVPGEQTQPPHGLF